MALVEGFNAPHITTLLDYDNYGYEEEDRALVTAFNRLDRLKRESELGNISFSVTEQDRQIFNPCLEISEADDASANYAPDWRKNLEQNAENMVSLVLSSEADQEIATYELDGSLDIDL